MEAWSFLLFSTGLIISTSSNPAAGPFDIYLTDMSHCPEPSKGVEYEHKLVRMSRKKLVITANISVHVPLNDELDVSINLAKQTNQGWKENFIILDFPKLCVFMRQYIPTLEEDLAKQMKVKHCPYPTGNFTVVVPLKIDVGVFPVFPCGKFRIKANVLKKDKRVFCIYGFVTITPKKSG